MTKERQMTRTKAGRDVINERLRWVRLVMGSAEKGRGVLMGNRIAGKGTKVYTSDYVMAQLSHAAFAACGGHTTEAHMKYKGQCTHVDLRASLNDLW
jgi:hypothetical protein